MEEGGEPDCHGGEEASPELECGGREEGGGLAHHVFLLLLNSPIFRGKNRE